MNDTITRQTATGPMEQLRALREARRLTQGALGYAVGTTGAAVSQWETGVSAPTMDRLRRLAAALGVTVGQVVGTEPLPVPSPPAPSCPTCDR